PELGLHARARQAKVIGFRVMGARDFPRPHRSGQIVHLETANEIGAKQADGDIPAAAGTTEADLGNEYAPTGRKRTIPCEVRRRVILRQWTEQLRDLIEIRS